MSEPFDPYRKWLGIPPQHQPPNHYRLLGIELFESDPDVIANAADQRMAHLKGFAGGQHASWSQRLLNEVSAARVALLNPEEKSRYDAALSGQQFHEAAAEAGPASSGAAIAVQPRIPPMRSRAAGNSAPNRRLLVPMIVSGVCGLILLSAIAFVLFSPGPKPAARMQPTKASGAKNASIAPATKGPGSNSVVANGAGGGTPSATAEQANPVPPEGPPEPTAAQGSAANPAPVVEPVAAVDAGNAQDSSPPPQPMNGQEGNAPAIADAGASTATTTATDTTEPASSTPEKSADRRLPVPSPEEIATAEQQIREVYGQKLTNADSPARKTALSAELASVAGTGSESPAMRYALLRSAAELDADAGEIEGAFEKIDRIGASFAMTSWALKAQMLERVESVALRSGNPLLGQEILSQAQAAIDTALRDGDVSSASQLLKAGVPSARRAKDRRLVAMLQEKAKDLDRVATEYGGIAERESAQELDLADAASRRLLGRWHALVRGDFARGLPHLASSKDGSYKEVAAADLANPTDGDAQAILGDRWWQTAKEEKGIEQARAEERAKFWFRRALKQLSGMNRAKLEKHLDELGLRLIPYALRFDGVKNAVVVKNFAYTGAAPITLEVWCRADRFDAGAAASPSRYLSIFGNHDGMRGLGLYHYFSQWSLEFAVRQPNSTLGKTERTQSTQQVAIGDWTHVAGVFDGTELRIYVNGRLNGKAAVSGPHFPNAAPFLIGAAPVYVSPGSKPPSQLLQNFFVGQVREVRVSSIPRYTKDFEPPREFTADGSVRLLFKLEEGKGSVLRDVSGGPAVGEIHGAEWVQLEVQP
ncbi:MAG: LamG-like jellyroll fold domain-containing protein [Planctomycetota bacterium]